MKRLVAIAAILLFAMSNFWCQCTSAPEFTEEEIVTCDEHVWLTTYPNLTSWNDNEAVSDSFLVSTSGVVNAASVVLDSSALMLDGQLSYLNLGHGFDNLEFPVSVVFRFSMEPGFTYGNLFATDEGLGYSGLAFYCGLEGVESFIGDGFGSGPGERRSKHASFDFEIGEWYTFVGVIRGATDHSLFIDGFDLGGYYSGSGNGEVVDLGRPATIGYFVADSGPATGQESSVPINVDFVGIYDYDISPMVEEFGNSCFQDSGSIDSLGVQVGALAWYDFDAENPFKDSSSIQPDIVADGNVQSEVVLCVCDNSVEIAVTIQETGCTDAEACNFNLEAACDDGSCDYSCCPGPGCCDVGTEWSWESNTCIVANPSDSNFDGCVQLNDLLDLLSAYGDCGAGESPWQCGDALEYQGYAYTTVQIGAQCWFAENLRAENYTNEDVIPDGLSNPEWVSTTSGARSFYGEDGNDCNSDCDEALNLAMYGRMYNGYAIMDERGVCPQSWSVGTDADWKELELLVGMNPSEIDATGFRGVDEGQKLKASQLSTPPWNGTNEFDMNISAGSGRSWSYGTMWGVGIQCCAYYWTSTFENTGHFARVFSMEESRIERAEYPLASGMYVRCIKDAE